MHLKNLKELKNIWTLTKTGSIEPRSRSPKQMVFFILKMLLILMSFKAISIGLVLLLDYLNIFAMPVNINAHKLQELKDLEILLLVAVYAPIIEEIAFRLPLKFSSINFIIASVGLSLLTFRFFTELNYAYCLALSIGVGIILYFSISEGNEVRLSQFWKNNSVLIFYTLLLTFSFSHLQNYEITKELLLFSPIVILLRILGGIVYSYIRLNSGIVLAICFHAFNNGFLKVISMIVN